MESNVNSVLKPPRRIVDVRIGIAVFLVAVVFRGAIGWGFADHLNADPDAYGAIADSIRRSGVYGLIDDQGIALPTAFRPPLYPWILSQLPSGDQGHRFGVVVLHTLLGGWTVLATFMISRRFVSGRWSCFAAGLVAVDPVLLMQSTLLMTETLATALSATVLWWCAGMDWTPPLHRNGEQCRPEQAQRSSGNTPSDCLNCAALVPAYIVPAYVVLGFLLTLSYLCRPTFLVWAVLLAFALASVSIWRERLSSWRKSLLMSVVVLSIVAMGVGAWTLRNWRAIGHPVWATTHGGYTLLLGNNSQFYHHLRTSKFGEVWDAEEFLKAYKNRVSEAPEITSEHVDDRWAYEKAKATIARQPKMFAYSCVVRLGRLWSPVPHLVQGRSYAMNLAVGVFYSCVFLMSLVGLFKLRRQWSTPFLLAGLTLAITLSLVHSVYWSNMRMRAPLAPALAVVAVAGCCPSRKNS